MRSPSSATARCSSSRARSSTSTRSHARLEPLGDSLLVTGDESVAKVHVHTDEPEGRSTSAARSGVVDEARVEIGDMHSQAAERERWLAQLHAAAQAPHARDGARRGRPGSGQPRHPPERGRERS